MTPPSVESVIDQENESQYNLRIRHPERKQIYEDYSRRSLVTRQNPGARLDIRFGEKPSSLLDLFVPAGLDGLPPLLVFIHGGYWRALDKQDFSFVADAYLKQGVAVAMPNYTLAPLASVEEIFHEVCLSLAWLVEHGEDLGFDPYRIVLSGHSAGGHMAVAAACRGHMPELEGRLIGCIGISGLFDLTPLLSTSVNFDLRMTVREAETLRIYGRGDLYDVPIVLASGELETQGFRSQSQGFAEFCAGRGLQVRNMVVRGRTHFDILAEFSEEGWPLFDQTLDLLDGSLDTLTFMER